MNNTVIFFGATLATCLFTNGLHAWQRTAMEDCKKKDATCMKDADKKTDAAAKAKAKEECKRNMEMCKKNANASDEDSFSSALSQNSRKQYMTMDSSQRTKAMDYADGNKMSPDDAVMKVMGSNMAPSKKY